MAQNPALIGSRAKGRRYALKPSDALQLVLDYQKGALSIDELAEKYGIGRMTVYRTIRRLTSPEPVEAAS